MPQTREHLAIVELLGIRQALVALSKIDRVDAARVAEVGEQIAALLAPGPLAGSAIYPLSSLTGEGVAALRQALLDAARACRQRSGEGYFRLPIDRAFSLSGAGVVVTGTAFAGQVRVGDELLLSPAGRPLRVRGLHAQNREAHKAHAGQRVALNLAGERLTLEQFHRGDWLLQPTLHAPTSRIDCELQLLPGEPRELMHWTPLHVHLGAQDVTARVALLEGESLAPGARMLAQLLLNAPVHAVHGDRLVLRDQSARRTLGGGLVLDPFAPARHRRGEARLSQLRALRGATLESALPALLATADNGLDPLALERQFNRPQASWQLPDAVLSIATRLGPRLFDRQRWQALGDRLVEGLERFHAEQPDELGPDRDRLRRYALAQLERPLFIALLEQAMAAGRIEASGPWLHRPEHRVRLSAADEALKERLWPLLEGGGFDPPWVRDLGRALTVEEGEVRLLLRKLARLGLLQQVVKDLFYPETTLRQLANEVLRLEDQAGVIRAAAFRDRIQLGRKRSIQILEHFDRIGLTRRFGNERKVRRDSALALGCGSSPLAGDTVGNSVIASKELGVPLAATGSADSAPG
jgi:selenocysteine-specific elongation factor